MNNKRNIMFLIANEKQIISDKYWYFALEEKTVKELGGIKKTAWKIENLLLSLLKKEVNNAFKNNNETFLQYLMFIYNVYNLKELKTILLKKEEKLEEILYEEFVDFLPDIEVDKNDISEYLEKEGINNLSFYHSNNLMDFHKTIEENTCIYFYNERIPFYKNYEEAIKTIYKKELKKIKKQLKIK